MQIPKNMFESDNGDVRRLIRDFNLKFFLCLQIKLIRLWHFVLQLSPIVYCQIQKYIFFKSLYDDGSNYKELFHVIFLVITQLKWSLFFGLLFMFFYCGCYYCCCCVVCVCVCGGGCCSSVKCQCVGNVDGILGV